MLTEKVVVCGFVWMSNHAHMQMVCLDAQSFANFYGRLKKGLTDSLKRLLALMYLELWEDTRCPAVLDVATMIERFVYSYLNPVRAGLCRTIDEYEGCNSWHEFLTAPADVNARIEISLPLIRTRDLCALSDRDPDVEEERGLIDRILSRARRRSSVTLVIEPFRWLKSFGVTSPERVAWVREQIVQGVRKGEAEEAEKRRKAAEAEQARENELHELEAKLLAVAREQLQAEQEGAERAERSELVQQYPGHRAPVRAPAPHHPHTVLDGAPQPHGEPQTAPTAQIRAVGLTAPETPAAPSKSILRRMLEQIPVIPVKPRPEWDRLRGFVVTNEYLPGPREREIVVLASTVGRRVEYLNKRTIFITTCRKCYRMAKEYIKDIPWPAGAFIPPLPMRANALRKT
jgi:hypothetical protein